MQNQRKDIYPDKKRFVFPGKALSVSSPAIMGIVNITPDSFYDGGRWRDIEFTLGRIGKMVLDGAGIIDIGGESTRPGSRPVSEKEELNRVLPILEKAVPAYPDTLFSIDTTKYEVARQALGCGAKMVNDVSGLQKEPRLAALCASFDTPLVIMHSKGQPQTMQRNPSYENVVEEIIRFLKEKCDFAEKEGVSHLIVDPGIGFGKTPAHNLTIIKNLKKFKALSHPVLVGASRKSVIGKILSDNNEERPVHGRLAGTLALHYHALCEGADILRVHDVPETNDIIKVFNALHHHK